MTEEWQAISGYEDRYEVSNLGRVRSLARHDSNKHYWPSKIRKLKVRDNGYLEIGLCANGNISHRLVHALVAESFISNPHNYPLVRHKDNNKANNAVNNLAWGTHYDNVADRYGFTEAHGRHKVCARGHELHDGNTTAVSRGVQCLACKRANVAFSNRKRKGAPLEIDHEHLADIFYVAQQADQVFKGGCYKMEDLEVKYGAEAKAWRASLQDQASAA